MGTIRKRGAKYRAWAGSGLARKSATFGTRQEAAAWVLQAEAEARPGHVAVRTLRQALERFSESELPKRRGARTEAVRVRSLGRAAIADRPLPRLSTQDLAAWRDARLAAVSPATVNRELNTLRSVLKLARKEWGWIQHDPIKDLAKPRNPPSRKRRITTEEIDRVTLALGLLPGELRSTLAKQRTALAFLLALETAMRAGEVLGLRRADVELSRRFVRLRETKNGDAREVPLSARAIEILTHVMANGDDPVFNLNTGTRDTLFRKAAKAAGVDDLHFHDSRAEGIWRLSKKLDVLQLARVIGHRDLQSLMIYYNESAEDMARLL